MDDSFDNYLERALSAAFAPDGDAGDEPPAPPEDPPAAAPVAPSAAAVPEQIGRYRVTALVGRGGTGLVLGAIDPDLERTVAIKVLHDRLGSDREMRRRFQDEARLTSRLQHPGIPPVHEMGRTGDGRPYFSMKLVEGETLARELFARSDPSERRSRFVEIFLKVSETVAYAHAAGVVHRDLKPANVLLGAFGEILVLDWGFAAVTNDPLTTAGGVPADAAAGLRARIVGTPAYMSPEQARGDGGPPDVRTDVFALGAILCEILSGRPPYAGETPSDILLSASRAWLDDANERLATCGADPALIDIARRCLAADAASRPADAGVVAAAVRIFLESQEERARALGIQAAEARAHAAHERRQRRLAVGLFSTFALALTVAGLAWAWMQHLRSERIREHQRVLEGGTAQILAVLRNAREAQEPDPRAWEEAVLAADRTLRISRDLGVPAEDLDAIEALRAQALAGSGEARSLRRCLERLLAIREHVEDHRDARTRDAAFAEIFSEAGVILDTAGITAAGRAITGSPIRNALVAALDGWAAARSAAGDPTGAARLLDVAGSADGDDWRERVRRAVLAGDRETLEQLGSAPETLDQPATSLVLLGAGLLRRGAVGAAQDLLTRAAIRHPGDYGIHHELGILHSRGRRPDPAEAARHFSMAVAASPASIHARLDLAETLIGADRHGDARPLLNEVRRLDPGCVPAIHYLGVIRMKEGDPESAVRLAEEALSVDAGFAPSLGLKGAILKSLGRFEEAAEAFLRASRAEPRSGRFQLMLAEILDQQGRRHEALDVLREAVVSAPGSALVWYNLGVHIETGDVEEAAATFEKAVELDPEYAEAHCNLAGVLKRQGRFSRALDHARRGHELGTARGAAWTYPSGEWVAEMESLVSLEATLADPEGIDSADQPPRRLLALAEAASLTRRHRQAVELFRRLFDPEAAHPPGLGARHRLQAVTAAVALGTGAPDANVSARDRAGFLPDALGWLEEDLAIFENLATNGNRADDIAALLDSWLTDRGLVPVRDREGLAALPEPERKTWIDFWARVQALRGAL